MDKLEERANNKRKYNLNRYYENKQHYKEYMKKYIKTEKFKNYLKEYRKKRYQNDIGFRILTNIRTRTYLAIKNNSGIKSFKTISILGCNIEELKQHLEEQFEENMSWENYGNWHIDHILPCAKFDLTNLEQQKKCFHYTNLQPLWAKENQIKNRK